MFHGTMCLAAMYLAMLLTGWNTMEGTNDELVLDRSMASVWIKVISSWVCYGIYILVLVLLPCCPDRQYGEGRDLDARP